MLPNPRCRPEGTALQGLRSRGHWAQRGCAPTKSEQPQKGGPGCWESLVGERVDHGDVGVDFDGLAVEDGWAIAPFADGGESGLD